MKRIYNLLALLVLFSVAGYTGLQDAFAAAPTTQARSITFSNYASTSITTNWLNGNGTGRIVVVYTEDVDEATIDGIVSNGTTYTASSDFSTTGVARILNDGDDKAVIVYKGTGSTRKVDVSGLSAGTTYNVKVYEYRIDGGVDPEYNKSGLSTNNPRSFTTLGLLPPTELAETETDQGWTSTWTASVGATGYEITVTDNSNVTLTDWNEVDLGDVEEYEVTGLSSSTTYKYKLRAYSTTEYSAWTSLETVVTLEDETPPVLIGIERSGNNNISLVFNENIQETDSEEAFLITIPGYNGGTPFIPYSASVSGDFKLNLELTMSDTPLLDIINGENVTIELASDGITYTLADLGGNDVDDFVEILYDWTPPAVFNILRNDNQYTNGSTASFSVDFDEPILKSSLTAADFALTGAAAASSGKAIASINPVTEGGDFSTSFTVNVTGIDVEGDLELEFTGEVYDAITDGSANLSEETYSDGEVYTFDYTKPENGLATITAVSIGAFNLDGAGRTALLDAGDDNSNFEYMNISKRDDADLVYIRVTVDAPLDESMNNGNFAIKYKIAGGLAPEGFGGSYLMDSEDAIIYTTITNETEATYDITVPANSNLGAALLADNDEANGVEYEFAVEYTDRAGNIVEVETLTNEKVIKDIVRPEIQGYVVNAKSSSTVEATGKFFINGDDYYYNSTTGDVTIRVASVDPDDATIAGQNVNVLFVEDEIGSHTSVDSDIANGLYSPSGENTYIDIVVDATDINDGITAYGLNHEPNNTYQFVIDMFDVAGNFVAESIDVDYDNNYDSDFSFRYDITPLEGSLTFDTPNNYARLLDNPATELDYENKVTIEFGANSDERGGSFIDVNFNGIAVQETSWVEEDYIDDPVVYTGWVAEYTVLEGHQFRSDDEEVPFSITIRDRAGNLTTITDETENGITTDWSDDQPGIDPIIPEYTAGTIDLTPRNAGNDATVGAFGDLDGDAVVSTNTTYIETLIDLETATENMNGGTLRVYPSYDPFEGFNGYFEYPLNANDEFDVDVLLSNLTGSQDGEDVAEDADWAWNASANGEEQIFFKFKFVSVGGNVGEFFPGSSVGGFHVDVVRPEGTVVDRRSSLLGVFGVVGDFTELNSQYTYSDVVGHKVTFDENVQISVSDEYLRIVGINGTTVTITNGTDGGINNGSLNSVVSDIRGRFNTLGNELNNDPDDEWVVFSHFAFGNGDVRMVLKADSAGAPRVYDAAGNSLASDIELTATYPVTIDNIAPADVSVTATADAGNTGYYKNGATKITVSFEMPDDLTLDGGTYDIQYHNGTNWVTISNLNEPPFVFTGDNIPIDNLMIDTQISIEIPEYILNDGIYGNDIITDGETVPFRVVLTDRAGNSTETSGNDITFDLTAPSITSIERTGDAPELATSTPVSFTVTFSENIDPSTLSAGDFIVTQVEGDVVGNITITNITDNVATIEVDVTDGGGVIRLDFDYDLEDFTDLAGNANNEDYSNLLGEVYEIDITDPEVVSIERLDPADQYINGSTNGVLYQVTFSEAIDWETISEADFEIITVDGITGTITMEPETTNVATYIFTVSEFNGEGTFTIDVKNDAVIKDESGNDLAASVYTPQSYIRDLTPPTSVEVTAASNVGTGEYYNIAAGQVNVSFDVPEEVGGTYTLQVWDADANSGDGGWVNVSLALTDVDILTPTGATTNDEAGDPASITVSEATLEGLGIIKGAAGSDNDGNIMKFRLNIVDAAGNETISTEVNESADITIDETAPVAQTITRKATNIPTNFASFADLTTAYTNQDYIAHRVDFSEPVLIGSTFYTASGDDENVGDDEFSTRDNTASSGTPNIFQLFSPGKFNQSNNVSIFDESWLIYAGYVGNGNVNIYLVASFGGTDYVTDVAGNVAVNTAGTIELTTVGNEIILDNIAPNAPVITSVGPDTGISDTDEITNTGELTISGTAEANSTVTIYNGMTELATTTASGLGAWTVTFDGNGDPLPAPLTAGEYTFTATATDAATNVSDASAANGPWVIDLTAPTAANVTGLTSVGGTVESNYFNGTNDDVSFQFTIPNDISLVGGTYTVEFTTNNGTTWAPITAPDYDENAILADDEDNGDGNVAEIGKLQTITLLEAELATLSGGTLNDEEVLNFRVVLVDLAGNETIGDAAETGITVDQTDPTLSVATPVGCINEGNDETTDFNIVVTVEDAAYTSNPDNYVGSVGGQALTINSVSGTGTSRTLNVNLEDAGMLTTGLYDLSITLTDLAGNDITVTNDGDPDDQIKFSTATDPLVKLVETSIDVETELNYPLGEGVYDGFTAETTVTACADGTSSFDFKYILSEDEGDTENVVVNKNGSPLTLGDDYSINTITNLIQIDNDAVANGDVITITLSGSFTCADVVSDDLTVVKNVLPDAATFTRTGTENPVCYNDNSGVVLTIDQAVTNKDAFSNYTYEISVNGGAYAAIPSNVRFALTGTKNSVLTITNIGTDFPTCSTYTVRVTKTLSETGCTRTSISDAITVSREFSTDVAYGSASTAQRNQTVSYTFTAPTVGTVTSYRWRVTNTSGDSLTSANVSYTATTTTPTNNIYFSTSIPFGTYYIQVQPINSCQAYSTLRWEDVSDANNRRTITVSPTPSSAITFSSVGQNQMTVGWTNGSYDGKYIISKQNSTTTNFMAGAITNTGGTVASVLSGMEAGANLNWSAASSNANFEYGGSPNNGSNLSPVDNGTKLLARINDNTTRNITVTGLVKSKRYHFRIIDFNNTTTPTELFLDASGPANSRGTSAKEGDEFSGPGSMNSVSAISPNPAKDFINFDLTLVEDANVTITIHSLEGSVVMNIKANELMSAGTHNFNIPLKDLAAGAYAISFSFGQDAILETFMVMP